MCAIIKKLSFTDKAGIFFAAVRGEFLLRIPVACGVGALYGKTANDFLRGFESRPKVTSVAKWLRRKTENLTKFCSFGCGKYGICS